MLLGALLPRPACRVRGMPVPPRHNRSRARRQDKMHVAVKYVKPVQQMCTTSMERKPVHVVFRELQLEVEALTLLPSRHPNVVGLEAVVVRFPAETDPNQEVRVGRVRNFQSLRVLQREHAWKVLLRSTCPRTHVRDADESLVEFRTGPSGSFSSCATGAISTRCCTATSSRLRTQCVCEWRVTLPLG